jgi:TetR/AcrR family transcriptional regulator, mexJK operon transcriptional repressor
MVCVSTTLSVPLRTVGKSNLKTGRKASQILQSATRMFMANGFMATSMDMVARDAGVSKATLYSHFSGKADLLRSVIAREEEELIREIPASLDRDSLRSGLTDLGNTLLRYTLDERAIAGYRLVIAESLQFPEVGKIFYEGGPRRLYERLEVMFSGLMAADILQKRNPRSAAMQFVSVISAHAQMRALMGIASEICPDASDEVQESVDMFLRAYMPAF